MGAQVKIRSGQPRGGQFWCATCLGQPYCGAMAEEEWIQATQETLGKLISKPKMTEKYLKKPPFRFLHDIVQEVVRTTGFANGLFTAEEQDAAALSDKQA